MLLKTYKRLQARRAVVRAALSVAASYEPALEVHQHDPDDLAHLRSATAKYDATDPFPYSLRWERKPGQRGFSYRSGQAAEWPWWELALPRWGSLIVGRKAPRV